MYKQLKVIFPLSLLATAYAPVHADVVEAMGSKGYEERSHHHREIHHESHSIFHFHKGDKPRKAVVIPDYKKPPYEYATLNTQILGRSRYTNDILRDFAFGEESFLTAKYTQDNNFEANAMLDLAFIKLGVFYKKELELNGGMEEVVANDAEEGTVLVGFDDLFLPYQNITIGVANSSYQYDTGSKNEVRSAIASVNQGIALNERLHYNLIFNAVYSKNNFSRAYCEAQAKCQGQTKFNSLSMSLKNELSYGYEDYLGKYRYSLGVNTTKFKHDKIAEFGSEDRKNWIEGNNSSVIAANDLISNEVYVNLSYKLTPIKLGYFFSLSVGTDIEYSYDLNPSAKWHDRLSIHGLDISYRNIGDTFSANEKGYLKGSVNASMRLYDHLDLSVATSYDINKKRETYATVSLAF